MEVCDVSCCDTKHNESEDDSRQAHEPNPLKASGRGFIACIRLHFDDWLINGCRECKTERRQRRMGL